jgi:transcriptional regulator with XRE-family HTH domain
MHTEAQRLIDLLQLAMRVSGVTERDVEQKLKWDPNSLRRLFSGDVDLTVEHMFLIAGALGLTPGEFIQLAFPRRIQPSRAAEQLRELIRDLPRSRRQEA